MNKTNKVWEIIFRPPCYGTPDYFQCLLVKRCPRLVECHKQLQDRLYKELRVMKWRTKAFEFQMQRRTIRKGVRKDEEETD